MKKKEYLTPEIQVVKLKMSQCLLAGSITESTSSAAEMSSGSFGAKGSSFWSDEEEED